MDRAPAPIAASPKEDLGPVAEFSQWRYLPERYGAWTAVWAQWRRWRASGVWARAMTRLAAIVRVLHDREPGSSMVMVDAQTARGARYGPTFHEPGGRGGRTIGTKRTLLVEILGLPIAAEAGSARPHDVTAARELLRHELPALARVQAIVGDRAYRGLARLARRNDPRLVAERSAGRMIEASSG